jgi:hypothetical protein
MTLISDVKIQIEFIPYLITDGNQTHRLIKNSKLTKYIFEKKLSKIQKLVKQILFTFDIKKYVFDLNDLKIKVDLTIPKTKCKYFRINENNENDNKLTPSVLKYNKNYTKESLITMIKQDIEGSFGYEKGGKSLIGDVGPDTWMGGNIELIKSTELDNKSYEFGISTKKIRYEFAKLRPSPSNSATAYKVGTKKKGNDGNTWIVVINANSVKRWKKI